MRYRQRWRPVVPDSALDDGWELGMKSTTARDVRFHRLALALGLLLAMAACAVILGWALDITVLKTVFPGLVTMKVNTALGLGLCGVGLVVLAREPVPIVVPVLAGLVIAIGAITLAEYFLGRDLWIDQALIRDDLTITVGTSAPGRMAPSTAFCFILAGTALLSSTGRLRRRLPLPVSPAIGASLLIIGLVGLFGQVTNALGFAIWNYSGMAIHTALGFSAIGAGLLALELGMRQFHWSLDPITTLGFAVAVAVMLGVTGLSWNYTYRMQQAGNLVSHANELLKTMENIRSGMSALENGQRGFVITGEEGYIGQRPEWRALVQENLATLQHLAQDDPALEKRLGELVAKIDTRNAFGDETIQARREHGFTAGQEMVAGGRGAELSREIDQLLSRMRDEEYARLQARQQEVAAASTTTFLFLPASVYLSLAILSLALFFLNATAGERQRAAAGRRQAEEALHDSEQQFRNLANAIPQLAWMADRNGSIFWYNQRWYDYTGTTFESMQGWGWKSVHDPAILPKVIAGWNEALASGEPWEMEFPLRRKDGTFGWFLTRVTPFRDHRGNVLQWFGTNTDITQQREDAQRIRDLAVNLEKRVAERTAELEHANKELEAFSYSVSHDLRAPLRAVDGYSQSVLVEYGPQLDDQGRSDLATIRTSAQRMGALIDDLLAFSRLSRAPLNRREVNMEKIVRHVVDEMENQREGREVAVTIGDLPACQGDSALLTQAWTNLISNAHKYTRGREKAEIEIGCRMENGVANYFVRDNGAGFDMRYAHKLFGVFQRLHRLDEFEGTGVGLAIVHRVITRHGGEVRADAAVGRGATFSFTIPQGKPEKES